MTSFIACAGYDDLAGFAVKGSVREGNGTGVTDAHVDAPYGNARKADKAFLSFCSRCGKGLGAGTHRNGCSCYRFTGAVLKYLHKQKACIPIHAAERSAAASVAAEIYPIIGYVDDAVQQFISRGGIQVVPFYFLNVSCKVVVNILIFLIGRGRNKVIVADRRITECFDGDNSLFSDFGERLGIARICDNVISGESALPGFF